MGEVTASALVPNLDRKNKLLMSQMNSLTLIRQENGSLYSQALFRKNSLAFHILNMKKNRSPQCPFLENDLSHYVVIKISAQNVPCPKSG